MKYEILTIVSTQKPFAAEVVVLSMNRAAFVEGSHEASETDGVIEGRGPEVGLARPLGSI